jgi:hypothetical protein
MGDTMSALNGFGLLADLCKPEELKAAERQTSTQNAD